MPAPANRLSGAWWAHALDIPPTFLSLLGASIPAHFDGKPLPVTTGAATMAKAG